MSRLCRKEDGSFLLGSGPQPQVFFSTPAHISSFEDMDNADSEVSDGGSSSNQTLPSLPIRRQSSAGLSSMMRSRSSGTFGARSHIGVSTAVSDAGSGTDTGDQTSLSFPTENDMKLLSRPLTRSELALCLLAEVCHPSSPPSLLNSPDQTDGRRRLHTSMTRTSGATSACCFTSRLYAWTPTSRQCRTTVCFCW